MHSFPMYNGQNLDFTGKVNPYGLIQMAGKRKSRRIKGKKSMRKRERGHKYKLRKTRKYKN